MKGNNNNMKKLTTFLWFEKEAAEAAKFYASVFKDSKITETRKLENTPSGTVEIVSMEIFDCHFQLMSAGPFVKFNEAISFVVECESQKEIDYYWEKLSADPKAEQCGWLKDKYGVSWQIVPTALFIMQKSSDKAKVARVTEAFLKMKKFDIAELQQAFDGK
jgi:predicted 3-demethylubiquinone-9 3-methyltransferase (glyoxalase superfamily)